MRPQESSGYQGNPGHCGAGLQAAGEGRTLRELDLHRRGVPMTKILLALLPLAMVTGFLTWVMIMGARDQARSDAWARDWASRREGA